MYKALKKFAHKTALSLTGSPALNGKPPPSSGTLRLWEALAELNSRLLVSPGCVLLQVEATHKDLGLTGKVSLNYIASVTPFLCRHNELMELRKWQNLSFLYKLGKQRNAWKLSLAIPALIVDGKIELATELLAEIAAKPSEGWLNTECIRFAVDQVLQQDLTEPYKVKTSVQFQEAFLNLLDAFKGNWFSRLHDLELIKATIALLANLKLYPQQHRSKVVSASIRHYGLCPTFWLLYSTQISEPTEPELIQAQAQWQTLYRLLVKNTSTPIQECFQELEKSLSWFDKKNNPEVRFFLRDIVLNHIKNPEKRINYAGQNMIDWLYQSDPADKHRLDTSYIWPTYQSPMFTENNNQLELISSPEQASKRLNHEILVVSVVRNEMILLPHFLEHYRKIGIKGFVFIDNSSTDGSREYLISQGDVTLYAAETEYKHSFYGVAWQQAVLGNHCLGKWVILADADEFLIYADFEHRSINEYIAKAENQGADAVLTLMIDMYPIGNLKNADFTKISPFQAAPWCDANPLIKWQLGSGQYNNGTNYLSKLRHRLVKTPQPNSFTSQKIALVRYQPWIRFSAGLHNAANVRLYSEHAAFAHFKYHAEFEKKVFEEVQRGQHYNNAEDYKHYLELFNGTSSRFWNSNSVMFTKSKKWLNILFKGEP